MIETTTTYVCDGCGYTTTNPEQSTPHAEVTFEVGWIRKNRGLLAGVGYPEPHQVYDTHPITAWVCGPCLNRMLNVIGRRVGA